MLDEALGLKGYRRMRKGDPNPIHFSPTDMAKCPLQLRAKKETGKVREISPELKEIFAKGNEIHVLEGIYRKGARGFVENELHMTMIRTTKDMIFSGYMDFLMIDEKGLYIEDLKSCNRNAFYHFNTNPEQFSEKIQVSSYRYLYYIIFGVRIDRAVITKIDRANTRNRISLEVPMYSIAYMEKFLEHHPAIRMALKYEITEEKFNEHSEHIIRKNRWVCNYCDDSKSCPINIKLTSEEKAEKALKKKAKAKFNKLVK